VRTTLPSGGCVGRFARGYYRDVFIGPSGKAQLDTGWHPNLVVQNCNVLLASLMKRQTGMQGILYLAIGQGDPQWDDQSPVALLTTSQLNTEVARQAITEDQIVFLDDEDQLTDEPTSRLQITVEFRGEELVPNGSLSLREFGLYGGDATGELNSGVIIDYVIHPRIELTPEMTLSRTLRLSFGVGSIPQEELAGFGADLPVSGIDGLGSGYASQLAGQGITTLGELVEIDPLVPIGNIPLVRLREFRAKARLVIGLKATLAPFAPFSDQSVSSILRARPEDLAASVSEPGITTETVTLLQEELAVLQIALDDEQLQQITIADLMNL